MKYTNTNLMALALTLSLVAPSAASAAKPQAAKKPAAVQAETSKEQRALKLASGERRVVAGNQIAIVVDTSGSYRSRFDQALARAAELLDGIAGADQKRWQKSRDQIVLVALDALPEVIWEGDLAALKAADRKQWSKLLRARKAYRRCTDVVAALNIALARLDGDPLLTSRYLFVFSDLVHEPPRNNLRRCIKPARKNPVPSDLDLKALSGMTAAAFWVPADQKFAYHRAAQEAGVAGTFGIYTPDESDAVVIKPPPPPKVAPEVKKAERQVAKAQVVDFGETLGWLSRWALMLGAGLVIVIMIAVFLRRRQLRRRPRRGGPRRRRPGARSPNPRPQGSPQRAPRQTRRASGVR